MKPHLPAALDVDARAFSYALEALTDKLGWELDQHKTSLASAARELLQARNKLRAQQVALRASAGALASSQRERLHPHAYRTQLQFLVGGRAELALAQAALDALAQAHEMQRLRVVALQARLEGLARHRSEAFAEFAQQMRRRQSAASDQDWLARSRWSAGTADPRTQAEPIW